MSLEQSIADLNETMKAHLAEMRKLIDAMGAPKNLPAAPATPSASKSSVKATPAAAGTTETPPPPAAPKSSDSGSTQPPAGATGSLDYEKDVKPLALKAIALGQKDAAKKQAYTDLLAKIGAPSAKAMSAEHYPAFVAGLKEIVS